MRAKTKIIRMPMAEFRSDKQQLDADRQQLIDLLSHVVVVAIRLKHHSIVAVAEHWIDMLKNNPRWWKEL